MSFESGSHVSLPGPIDIASQHNTLDTLRAGYTATLHTLVHHPAFTPDEVSLLEGSDSMRFNNHGYFATVTPEYPGVETFRYVARMTAGMQLDLRNVTVEENKVHDIVDAWIKASTGEYKAPILLSASEEVGKDTARYVAEQGHPVHWSGISGEVEVNYARNLKADFPDNFTSGVRATDLVGREEDPAAQEAYAAGDVQILETGSLDSRDLKLVIPVMLGLVASGQLRMERFVDSVSNQPQRMLRMMALSHQTLLGTRIPRSETQVLVAPYDVDCYGPFAGRLALGYISSVTIDGLQRYSATDGIEPLTARRMLRPGVRI